MTMVRWLIVGLVVCCVVVVIIAQAQQTLVNSDSVVEAVVTDEVATTTAVLRAEGEAATNVSTAVYRVVRVVDGDTIDVAIGGEVVRVRYLGIDTPETVHPSQSVECFGKEASARNKELVEGKLVRLERDISDTDKYGRLLRYVYVDGVFVNLALVQGGYASTLTYPPDVHFNEVFRNAETEAREGNNGLWGAGCEREADATASPQSDNLEPEGGGSCRIKGNISLEGERIYHTPGCEYYDKTIVTEPKGERWFCTEAEAIKAGWRKALNCVE